MIDTIIFDFGGVLLDLDFARTFLALKDVTGVDFSEDLQPTDPFSEIFFSYEKGLITDEALIWNIQRVSVKSQDPRKIVAAWNAMLLGCNSERFAMLESLGQQYRLLLLSNTNHLHIQWVRHDLKTQHSITDFEERFFDKVYYSYEIHHRKPDVSIYEYVTNNAVLDISKTLFIDDSMPNVTAAKAYGWQAVQHHPQVQDITEAIDGYLVQANAVT